MKLDRQGGTANAHYKSTLHKVSKGVYKGTEGPYPYKCPGANNATFTAANTVRLTKAKDGYVNYALVGKLR